jgi:hypothetical protein
VRENYQYRVIWQREGCRKKFKLCARLSTAERHIGLLTSNEPWKHIHDLKELGPDDLFCCDGYQCGCGGNTCAEHFTEKRESLPKLLYAEIEKRSVGEWERDLLKGIQ